MEKNSMARARINCPTKDPSDPGYQAECEFALEPSVSKLVDEAMASGWQLSRIARAIMLIAAQGLSSSEQNSGSGHLHS